MPFQPNRALLRVFIAVAISITSFAAAARPSIVVDVESGRVLHEEDAFLLWEPASLTKLMTAYVAFKEVESGRLTLKAPVRVSYLAASQPASHMAYPVGTVMTLDNALKMMLVKSANDISIAIGEAVSGSIDAFSDRMNAEARGLGMMDSHFVNPNGLHADDHYSTAYDMALLTRAIRREFPQYDHYFASEAITTGDHVYKGYNYLIGRFRGADGMKTGYVCESGFNLVGSATRNGTTLVAVVFGEMSSKDRAERAADLLEEGFSHVDELDRFPLISELRKPAERPKQVADIRKEVCSAEAGEERWADRSLDHFDTAALTPLTRDPVPIPVSLGGAEGASRSAVPLFGRYFGEIPMPVERPVSLTDEVAAFEEFEQRLGQSEIPIPVKRPQTGT